MSDYPGSNEPTRPMRWQGGPSQPQPAPTRREQPWPAQTRPEPTRQAQFRPTQSEPPQAWPLQAQHQYAETRRRRFPLKTVIGLVILLLLLVGADRVAAAVAENEMASQVQTSMHLSGQPNVNIQGFPFLTQLIGRDLHTVVITGSNLKDGQLDLTNINVTAHGLHIHGLKSASIDRLGGTVTITLASIANAANLPAQVTLRPTGPHTVQATVGALGLSATVTAEVTESAGNQIHVHVLNGSGLPFPTDFDVPIPSLPQGVSINSVIVTSAGVQVAFSGTNTSFSQ
jgi:hypothetical protein